MTKLAALKALMKSNGGIASWRYIYENIERYYPAAKASKVWDAALRGTLYREIRNDRVFKKIGVGVYALKEYDEQAEQQRVRENPVRMHSYMEGILVELGNYEQYDTYCADPSAQFRQGIPLRELTTVHDFPNFTYEDLVKLARRIDVIWFSAGGHSYPKRLVEVVDSIGTASEALSRMFQFIEFQTELYIIAPLKHVPKIQAMLSREPYARYEKRFTIRSYDKVQEHYDHRVKSEETRV